MSRPKGKGRPSLSRKDIVSRMQGKLEHLGLTNKLVGEVLEAFLDTYKECVIENERVEIRHFGVMQSSLVKGRIINHPETKEQVIAEPHYRIRFIPSQLFRQALREKAKVEVTKKQQG